MKRTYRTFATEEELRNEVLRRARLLLKTQRIDTVCTNYLNGVEWNALIRKTKAVPEGLEVDDDAIAQLARDVRDDTVYHEG